MVCVCFILFCFVANYVLLSACFAAVSSRTAGFSAVSTGLLAAPTTLLYAIMMYVSVVPTTVALRYSREGVRHVERDISGADDDEHENINTIQSQARRFMIQVCDDMSCVKSECFNVHCDIVVHNLLRE